MFLSRRLVTRTTVWRVHMDAKGLLKRDVNVIEICERKQQLNSIKNLMEKGTPMEVLHCVRDRKTWKTI